LDEQFLKNLEKSYVTDQKVLALIKAYRSLLYSDRKVAREYYKKNMQTAVNTN